ncbi:flagellar hook-associated protein FlgK [Leadbettera azotonutricia]|uniref:Flagellar hook-associated protein 1 n=1 Tax=Leadbettera azotonutricia (strain ATCC BAA-888 / DSM 13862 / ZAS-9) TaxID=545695 RepID=F5YDJ9_LEAAZ|nr:flagellar hook-associated protein FlgK [Leadbettera azotonutricia]AEF81296.1 flagellar hook-associated protein FlgK [Leadbettera azotonutricia ZAS-9]
MTSTFMPIEIGKRAVDAHQQALNVTGHNLSNASTEGYSRQRVEFTPFEPIYLPGLNREETPGQIGQGTVVERIERLRDQLLDRRIVAQAGGEGYWKTRDPYIRELENIYLEPGQNSIRSKMDEFWNSWQELSLHPADNAPRMAVLERGKTLVDGIHERYNALKRLQDQTDEDIRLTVGRVNDITKRIAALNDDIQKVKAQGDNPNDLLDRRDLLVDKLSSLINLSVDTRDPDEFMLHTGGVVLVQGRIGRQFDIARNTDTGYSDIVWNETREDLEFHNGDHNGSLGALLDLRDHTIQSEIQILDNMTMNFAGLVNEVHEKAYGANGVTGIDFFTEHSFVPNVNGNYDRDGDGEFDSSYIFRVSGTNALEPRAQAGLEGTITLSAADGQRQINYYPTDTVSDIVARINNSGAEVTARINRDGFLTLKGNPAETGASHAANPDFVIRHIEDSGHFLTGYAGLLNAPGAEGSYDWGRADAVSSLRGGAESWELAPIAHPSGWVEVNPALVRDPLSVAAGFGENGRTANPGNGEAAMAIASIRNTEVMVGQFRSFDDYFADSVGRIGLLGEQSERALETQNLIMKQLEEMRQSVSGVNIDEELANMIKYQHGYSAAARFITTVNSMLDTLINRMGV